MIFGVFMGVEESVRNGRSGWELDLDELLLIGLLS